jgi:hypothetical protein
MKLTRYELEEMTSTEIAKYLTDITQTDICKDEMYCKMVITIFMSKQRLYTQSF